MTLCWQFPYPTGVSVNKIYALNGNPVNTVTVLDGATNSTAVVRVGIAPLALAVNSVTNKIYVVTSNNVTLNDGATKATSTMASIVMPRRVVPVNNPWQPSAAERSPRWWITAEALRLPPGRWLRLSSAAKPGGGAA